MKEQKQCYSRWKISITQARQFILQTAETMLSLNEGTARTRTFNSFNATFVDTENYLSTESLKLIDREILRLRQKEYRRPLITVFALHHFWLFIKGDKTNSRVGVPNPVHGPVPVCGPLGNGPREWRESIMKFYFMGLSTQNQSPPPLVREARKVGDPF